MIDGPSTGALHASWAECERQLYPIVATDPSRYERIVEAVRALVDEMNVATSIEQLMAMWPDASKLLASVISARGLPVDLLPQDKIIGAAFALREREIQQLLHRKAREDRIRLARQVEQPWVLLDEAGKIELGLASPYRATEMHLASGLAVVSMVQSDPQTGAPVFVISVVKLDPWTGGLLDAEPGIVDWAEFARLDEFTISRDAIRDRISLSSDE